MITLILSMINRISKFLYWFKKSVKMVVVFVRYNIMKILKTKYCSKTIKKNKHQELSQMEDEGELLLFLNDS